MGRRSTPFFHDFFHRGAKLGNASNRYEYTCRRCGRVLKNRAESLVAHLVGARGCPHVAPDEAARVAVFINERNRRKERKRAQRGSVRPSAAAEAETAVPRRGDAEAAEPLNGLAALAEAGRQLEGPGRNEGADVNGAHAHAREPESPSGTSDDCSKVARKPVWRDYWLTQIPGSLFENSVDGDSEANGDRPTDGTSPAGEGLATAQTQVPKAGSSRKMASRTKSRAQAPEQSNGATLSPLQSPNKKVRGPFSPTRKKEIHEVRKMGACLRCRMLRKTVRSLSQSSRVGELTSMQCSGGDPCASCEKLRNKRLWRTPCMRIRLAQAFDLYAIRVLSQSPFEEDGAELVTGVFEQMWLRDSKDLASKQKLADQGGRLLLRHPKREDLYVYFGALLGQHQASEESHAGNGVPGPTRRPEPLLMPLEDQYQVAEKLDEYLGRLAKSPDDSDPSPLLQLTIGQATDMAVGMSVSCYNHLLKISLLLGAVDDLHLSFRTLSFHRPSSSGPSHRSSPPTLPSTSTTALPPPHPPPPPPSAPAFPSPRAVPLTAPPRRRTRCSPPISSRTSSGAPPCSATRCSRTWSAACCAATAGAASTSSPSPCCC